MEVEEKPEGTQKCILAPGPNAVDVSQEQDGGILKEIIREGVGDETPLVDDKVTVHYVGRLTDGTVFDSSRERDDYFTFNLGKGNVIKAWDIGVATMKKGEIATLYCQPDYAYGEAGSPPKIGPNAILVFEVELITWKGDDLSPDKSEGILRTKVQAGEGYSRPMDGAVLTVHLIGRYDKKQFEERDVTFALGEGSEHEIVSGVEIALEKFLKGEKSTLKLSPEYAFGNEGSAKYSIPPDAEVEYEVTLVDFEKAKESWELDPSEKLEQAVFLKTKGTNFFKVEKYQLAIKQYKKMIEYLENATDLEDDEKKKEQQALLLAGHLNLAIGYLKTNEPLLAEKECDKALVIDPENEKGHFRRGSALLALQEMERAKKDFNFVLDVDPKNKAAANQIIVCNNKIKEYRDKERKLYGNMFAKFAKQDLQDVGPQTKLERNVNSDVLENPGTWGDDSKVRDDINAAHGDASEKMDPELREKYIEAVQNLEGVTEMIP